MSVINRIPEGFGPGFLLYRVRECDAREGCRIRG